METAGRTELTVLVLSWLIADGAMAILIHLSRRFGWFDRPGGHKTHRDPTPVLGGVGIFIALVISLPLAGRPANPELSQPILGMLIGSTILLGMGIIDDFRPINAVVKLCVLTTVTVVISRMGICVSIFPGGSDNPLNLLITLIWIVGVTSATNSLDHANGTAAGSVAIACGAVFIMALGRGAEPAQFWLASIAVALAGSCAGFLRHNLSGGKIFLGDNGSLLLGFLAATNLVFARWSEDPLKSMILPGVILTVPLYDITLSTILRVKNGVVGSIREAIVYCGKDHLAHRLAALGFGKRLTLVAIYSLGLVSGAFALAIQGLESRLAYLSVFAVFLGLLVVLGMVLDRAPVHPRRPAAPTPRGCGDDAFAPGDLQATGERREPREWVDPSPRRRSRTGAPPPAVPMA